MPQQQQSKEWEESESWRLYCGADAGPLAGWSEEAGKQRGKELRDVTLRASLIARGALLPRDMRRRLSDPIDPDVIERRGPPSIPWEEKLLIGSAPSAAAPVSRDRFSLVATGVVRWGKAS